MIDVESVSKVFPARNGGGPVRALDGVSLEIEPGELVAVTGPSGSGKSTLLFTLGAMMEPTGGAVRLDDTSVYDLPAAERARLRQSRFGFVFQTFNLLPYLDCRDNVALPAVLAGSAKGPARDRAEEMLARLALTERIHHRPAELSVGERQRVALCRSLINGPALLLADEPTGNLDPDMTEQVMALLFELNEDGQTIVLVTHDHDLAERCSRVVRLRAGELEEDRPARVGRSVPQ